MSMNTLVGSEWIVRDMLSNKFHANTITVTSTDGDWVYYPVCPAWSTAAAEHGWRVLDEPALSPLDTKTVVALGAAAVIASPRKISRRSLFGLGWKSR